MKSPLKDFGALGNAAAKAHLAFCAQPWSLLHVIRDDDVLGSVVASELPDASLPRTLPHSTQETTRESRYGRSRPTTLGLQIPQSRSYLYTLGPKTR